jgi:hypothetical protein
VLNLSVSASFGANTPSPLASVSIGNSILNYSTPGAFSFNFGGTGVADLGTILSHEEVDSKLVLSIDFSVVNQTTGAIDDTITVDPSVSIGEVMTAPEPASAGLLGLGICSCAVYSLRRRTKLNGAMRTRPHR